MNQESRDLVSVIVPFLNGSQWLTEALQSVLNQTYTNWELIVIDDGSEETHSAVAKDFCRQYSNKIIYTEHEGHVNKGVSISRNEAAKLARGKYLAFLDADDKWTPQKLADQLAQLAIYPQAQVVCDAYVIWHSWHYKQAKDFVQSIGAPAGCYAPATLNKILYPLQDTTSPAPSGVMVTKAAFDNVGGFEPSFSGIYELYEDQAFFSKLYLQEAVCISEAANTWYRKRDNSMSSAGNDVTRYYTVRAFYLDWLQRYLYKHQIEDKRIDLLIERARKEMPATSHIL